MRLFESEVLKRKKIAVDVRKITGIVEEGDYRVRIYFGKHSVAVSDRFERVWKLVEGAKQRELAL